MHMKKSKGLDTHFTVAVSKIVSVILLSLITVTEHKKGENVE